MIVSARLGGMVQSSNEVRAKLARQARALNLRCGAAGVPALVLMTDDTRDADWLAAAAALPAGSAVVVRHRDARKREALARSLRAVCARGRVRLLIADDAALALRVRADGVHVPQAQLARIPGLRARHARWLLTAATHDAASVVAAERLGADAVFVSPVFATASHPGGQTLGRVRFAALAARVRIPALALGGIDDARLGELAPARVAGAGVIGAWIRS